ncbi:MAG: 3-dehydroquinate synthase [Candidatus Omnitrophica bacterium]|nr:3-dehydroquinate synthase [Candidatus Omnitrophota bacterium]
MKIVKVNLKRNPYQIIIGNNIIKSTGKYLKRINPGSAAYVISNTLIKNKFGKIILNSLEGCSFGVRFKLVADTERSKSLETAALVIRDITNYDKGKRVFIVALGGGVVGDLAGFVASIYKRGINYIQVPTTLLAQVDSSIGGKTGVDLSQGKNLLGAFYQPRLVLSDISCLKTLDTRQIRAGLAEIIKYAIIKDLTLFNYLEKNYQKVMALNLSCLEYIIYRCSLIKAKIVEKDEREEKGLRTILNFGHTVGHAIETAGGYRFYNHGEAVSLGMLAESRISEKLGLLKPKTLVRIKRLIEVVGLPQTIKKEVSFEKIIQAHYRDKKFIAGTNRFALIHDIGKVKITKNVPLQVIKDSIRERFTA